jgi:hypothetical protein
MNCTFINKHIFNFSVCLLLLHLPLRAIRNENGRVVEAGRCEKCFEQAASAAVYICDQMWRGTFGAIHKQSQMMCLNGARLCLQCGDALDQCHDKTEQCIKSAKSALKSSRGLLKKPQILEMKR